MIPDTLMTISQRPECLERVTMSLAVNSTSGSHIVCCCIDVARLATTDTSIKSTTNRLGANRRRVTRTPRDKTCVVVGEWWFVLCLAEFTFSLTLSTRNPNYQDSPFFTVWFYFTFYGVSRCYIHYWRIEGYHC